MAVNVSSSGGIYIEISATTAGFNDALKKADVDAKAAAKSISNSFSGALSTRQIEGALSSVTIEFAKLSNMSKAAKADLSQHDKVFSDIAAAMGKAGVEAQKYESHLKRALETKLAREQGQALNSLQRQLGLTAKETADLAKSMGLTVTEFTRAGRATQDFGSCLTTFGIQAYAAKKALDAALSFKDKVVESFDLAARYETLGVTMQQVGKTAGYSAVAIDENANALRRQGIAGNEARKGVAQLVQAQVDLRKSAELARIAQDAAVFDGGSSSEAFEKLVHGIQSAQTEVLRAIGINVNFEQSYAKLATQLGKATTDLTEQEKTQARVNAVTEAGARIGGSYEAAMETLGKQMGSLTRIQQDFLTDAGKLPLELAKSSGALKIYSNALEGVNASVLKLRGTTAGLTSEELDAAFKQGGLHGLREFIENTQAAREELARLQAQAKTAEAQGLDVSAYSTQLKALEQDFFGVRKEIEHLEAEILAYESEGSDPTEQEERERRLEALKAKALDGAAAIKTLRETLSNFFSGLGGADPGTHNAHVAAFEAGIASIDAAYNKTAERAKQLKKQSLDDQRDALRSYREAGKYTEAQFKAMDAAFVKELEALNSKGASGINQASKNLEDWRAAVEKTKISIGALEAQLATGKYDIFEREQIEIAKKYDEAIIKIGHDMDELAKKKGVGPARAAELEALKKTEALNQKNLDLVKAQEKEQQRQAQLIQSQAQFYKELEEMSGQYGLSIEAQNKLIEEQAKLWDRAEIPKHYIEQWKKLKALQNDRSPEAGITRAFQKYAAEASNLGKQTETIFTNLLTGMDSSIKGVWDQIYDKGKITLDSFKGLFKSFMAELSHYAITKPIMLSLVGGMTGDSAGGGSSALLGTAMKWLMGGGSSSTPNYTWTPAADYSNFDLGSAGGDWAGTGLFGGDYGTSLVEHGAGGMFSDNTGSMFSTAGKLINPSTWTGAIDKLSSAYSYVGDVANSGFSYLGSLFGAGSTGSAASGTSGAFMSALAEEAAAQSAAEIAAGTAAGLGNGVAAYGSAVLGASTASGALEAGFSSLSAGLSSVGHVLGAIGMGFTGYQVGSWAGGKLMGNDKASTKGAQDTGKIGAAAGAVGGLMAGAGIAVATGISATMTGAMLGSVVPGIGTLIGAAVGTIAGMLMGAGDVRKPTMRANVHGYLGYEDGEGPYTGVDMADNATVADYFGSQFAKWRREDKTQRTFIQQSENILVGTSGEHLGGGSAGMRALIDGMGQIYMTAMQQANTYAFQSAGIMNTVGKQGTVLDEDYKVITDPFESQGIGDKWLEALRKIEIEYSGKQDGSRLSQKGIDKMMEELTGEIEWAYQQAFASLDLSGIADRFEVDQSTYDGLKKFMEAVVVTQDVMARTDAMYKPTAITQVQEQVAEAMKATDEWRVKMSELGVVEDYADRLIDDFLYGTLQKFIREVDKGINPTDELSQALEKVNLQFDDLSIGAEMLGATTADLARVELLRMQALQQTARAMQDALYDDLRIRNLASAGLDTSGAQLEIKQRDERIKAAQQFGDGSQEYANVLATQNAERLRFAADKAKQEYDTMAQAMEAMSAAAEQTASAVDSARFALAQELPRAVEEARNGIKQAVDAWVAGAKSAYDTAIRSYTTALQADINAHKAVAERMRQAMNSLWTDSALNQQPTVYGSAKAQMDTLYAGALAGDTNAAGELGSVAKTFLDASYATQGDYSAYLADFDAVQAMLKTVADEAEARAAAGQTELDLLQSQLDAQDKANKSLAELRDAMNAAKVEFERARSEQAAAYAQWNLGTVSTGIANLEAAYREQVAAMIAAQAALDNALATGLITQMDLNASRVVDKLEQLRLALADAQKAQAAVGDTGEYALLQAKADAMNAGKTLAPGQKAGGWTAEKVKQEIITGQGMSGTAEWYARYGQGEGFTATGAIKTLAEAWQKFNDLSNAATQAGTDAYKNAVTTGNFAGSKYATEQELLEAKVAAMNAGKTLLPGQEAGGWTVSKVKQAILDDGMTTAQWYERWGKAEGFAAGGVATPGWALVGEQGPELVNFSSRAMVYPAADTARLLNMPAAGTDGSPAADRALLAELRASNAEMKEQNALLRAMLGKLTSVDKNTKNSTDFLGAIAGDTVKPQDGEQQLEPIMEWAN